MIQQIWSKIDNLAVDICPPAKQMLASVFSFFIRHVRSIRTTESFKMNLKMDTSSKHCTVQYIIWTRHNTHLPQQSAPCTWELLWCQRSTWWREDERRAAAQTPAEGPDPLLYPWPKSPPGTHWKKRYGRQRVRTNSILRQLKFRSYLNIQQQLKGWIEWNPFLLKKY